MESKDPPKSILILGSGVFGLSTAHALTQRPHYSHTTITLLDRSPFPPPDSSSIDTSRIIRADYSDPAYASLASEAQTLWRSGYGGPGAYSESGLVLVANEGEQGEKYVRASFDNVKALSSQAGDPDAIQELGSRKEINAAVGTGGGSGTWGYINKRSGWADAECAMVWLRRKIEGTKRVHFLTGEATALLKSGSKVLGAKLTTGEGLTADLTIVATGAWTPKLVNLQGRALATGQVLCYLPLSPSEQKVLGKMPVLLNMSTGLFIIPPSNNVLKIARHAYGLSNPVSIPDPDERSKTITTSLPRTSRDDPTLRVPLEGETACRQALEEMIPSLSTRPFSATRICWYTDTPAGDFIITYHPSHSGLFLATGGSGHAYKFLPVIGEKVVDTIEGRCDGAFREKWGWAERGTESVVTEDGSRGGRPGMVLDEELQTGMRGKL